METKLTYATFFLRLEGFNAEEVEHDRTRRRLLPVRRVIRACAHLGDVGMWTSGHVDLWRCGDMGMWGCGDVEICTVSSIYASRRSLQIQEGCAFVQTTYILSL